MSFFGRENETANMAHMPCTESMPGTGLLESSSSSTMGRKRLRIMEGLLRKRFGRHSKAWTCIRSMST